MAQYVQYRQLHRLTNGHTKGIVKAAFSPNGTFLATGGLDGQICVWHTETGSLSYVFSGTSEALEIVWASPDEVLMVCGLADGNIVVCDISRELIEVRGFFAHGFPVECLAMDGERLASGAGPELSVWRWDSSAKLFLREVNLEEPPKNSHNATKEVLVTSVHWTSPSGRRPALLVVTYLNHGIVLLDAVTWTRFHTFPLSGLIARASISDDGTRIVVSNVHRGFDIYSLESGEPLYTIDHEIRRKIPTPAAWIHGGLALLGASTAGQLTLWDVIDVRDDVREDEGRPSEARVLYMLPIPKQADAVAIAAHYNVHTDEFYVAAGVLNVNGPSPCIIWKTEKPRNMLGDTISEAAPSSIGSWLRNGSMYLSWAVSIICIAFLLHMWRIIPLDT